MKDQVPGQPICRANGPSHVGTSPYTSELIMRASGPVRRILVSVQGNGYELARLFSPSHAGQHLTTPALSVSAQSRLATIRAEISGRLWSINAGMDSKVYNGLMDQMALLQYNCEQRIVLEGVTERRSGALDRRSPAKEFLVRAAEPPAEPLGEEQH